MKSYACVSLIQIVKEYKCLEFSSKMAEKPVYYFLILYLTSVEILGQKCTCLSYRALSGCISTQDQCHANTTDPRELDLVPIHLFCCAPTSQMVLSLSVCTRIPVILMAFNVMLLFFPPKELMERGRGRKVLDEENA